MEGGSLLADLGLLLLAAVAGGLTAHALRQPPVVGYVLAGVAVGAATGGRGTSELFAQVGVVLLLFTAGVEFSLSDLQRARRLAAYGTPVGMAGIVLLVVVLGAAAGWELPQAVAVGASVSVMSTAVLFKFLQDRRELGSAHGRVLVGVSLAQDLVAVLVMALLPALSPGEAFSPAALRGVLQAAAVLAPLVWLARRLVPALLWRVAHTRSMELFLVTVVALAIGTGALASALGLSPALGAFLAGLMISESEFAHETLARVLPLRDVFVALFFVSVGMLLRPEVLTTQLPTVLGLAALVVVGNTLVWTAVARAAGYPRRVAVLFGLGLGQIGEFSYLIAGSARELGILDDRLHQAVLAASLLTILANAALFRARPRWLEAWLRVERAAEPAPPAPGEPSGHAVICGFGRVGREVAEALQAFGIPYAVVDLDPEALREARARGAVAVFGEAASHRALERAGVPRARLAVVAVPEAAAAVRCVQAIRQLNPQVPVLARAHHASTRGVLLEAGATEVVQPEVEAALTMVRHSLDWLGVPHEAGRAYLKQARSHWPEALRSEGFAEGLEAREVVVRSGRLAGRSLRSARLTERTGAVVAAVTHPDGREVVNPGPEEVLRRGDRLVAMGEPAQLDALERVCAEGADGGEPERV
jgi:CPA2 family monovalent cation:H+ antiporter-2